MSSNKFFYIVIFGFMLGVLWRSFFDFKFEFTALIFLIGFLFICFYFLFKKQKLVIFLMFSIFFISASLGILRFDIEKSSSNPNALDEYLNEELLVEAVVVEEVEKSLDNAKVVALVKDIDEESIKEEVKISIITKPFVSLNYGDRIKIEGELLKPENFESENGREFDYVSYLAKDKIFYQSFYPNIIKISSGEGNFIKRGLLNLKDSFLEKIKSIIPSPESDLLGGLLLGSKGPLGDELQEDFRKTGLIHIVVLSGYNITVVAEAVTKFFSFVFSTVWCSVFSSFAIICFAILTGASATVVRASIMALLVILARTTGRSYEVTRALLLAGFLMIIYDPEILVFDPSFQLSFVATLGLILFSPYFEKVFSFVPKIGGLREVAGATISTQIFILPLILYMMGELSIVSVPVNLLVLITIPLVMLLGFFTGVLSFLSVLVAVPFAYASYFLLFYQMSVVKLFASFPFSSIKIDNFPLYLLFLIYLFYAFILYKIYYYKRTNKISVYAK